MLNLSTIFSGLERYSLPAERVVVASLQSDLCNDNISRIRNVVIADAIEVDINNTGTVRSHLQSVLGKLADSLPSERLNHLIRCRNAGEWLLDFFQQVPLGAIYMMGKQSFT